LEALAIVLAVAVSRRWRDALIGAAGAVAHLEENMGAAAVSLDDEDLSALEQVRQVGDPLAAAHE
jgi:aryl-alcohol dehydrogenase-like predicted oxidoreductase